MATKTAIICDYDGAVAHVYGDGRRERIAGISDLHPELITKAVFDRQAAGLRDCEAIFSTWGLWPFTPEQLEALPRLRAVFYAAGTVKSFATPFLDRGITVCSAWGANAIPVAEFTLAQILLANKGYFRNVVDCRDPALMKKRGCFNGPGNYGETVALLGCGQIARKLIELLQPFKLRIIVYDPYLGDEAARELGVRRVSLETAFAEASVVSNHMPNLPDITGILGARLFESMRPHATFINTARGAQVNEAELVSVLRRRTDLDALLDVTFPEPPELDSPLFTLSNIRLSSHIAGSLGMEARRMADFMIEEFLAWQAGKPLRYALTREMLARMA